MRVFRTSIYDRILKASEKFSIATGYPPDTIELSQSEWKELQAWWDVHVTNPFDQLHTARLQTQLRKGMVIAGMDIILKD